jgi:hypothetical protein
LLGSILEVGITPGVYIKGYNVSVGVGVNLVEDGKVGVNVEVMVGVNIDGLVIFWVGPVSDIVRVAFALIIWDERIAGGAEFPLQPAAAIMQKSRGSQKEMSFFRDMVKGV